MGPEKKSHKVLEEDRKLVAYHEAGHALVSYLSGEKPNYVTIVSRGDYGGFVEHAEDEKRFGYNKREMLNLIRTALAGRAAEILCYGDEDGLSTGPSSDLMKATRIAEQMIGIYGMDPIFGMATLRNVEGDLALQLRKAVNDILCRELENAIQEIETHRNAFDAVVNALIDKNSLKGDELDNIIGNVV